MPPADEQKNPTSALQAQAPDQGTDPRPMLVRMARAVKWSGERLAVTFQTKTGKQVAVPWAETVDLTRMTHLSVGMFRHNDPRDGGEFYRRAETWTGCLALVLDDIGTKAKPPKLEPTVKIETSPSNEQWVDVFREPVRSAPTVDRMMRALVNAGHADPGGSVGRTALIRVFRLPGSDPKGRGYPARITFEDWSRLFPGDIATLFGPKGFNLPVPSHSNITAAEEGVFEVLTDDPLLRWLGANGWLRDQRPNAQGWVACACPWHHLHTGGVTTGTGYRSTTPRGVNCYHAACRDKQPVDFLIEWGRLGAPVAPPGQTPSPEAVSEAMSRTVKTALRDRNAAKTIGAPKDAHSALRAGLMLAGWRMAPETAAAVLARLSPAYSLHDMRAVAHHAGSLDAQSRREHDAAMAGPPPESLTDAGGRYAAAVEAGWVPELETITPEGGLDAN